MEDQPTDIPKSSTLSRREFLRQAGLAATGALLSSMGSAAPVGASENQKQTQPATVNNLPDAPATPTDIFISTLSPEQSPLFNNLEEFKSVVDQEQQKYRQIVEISSIDFVGPVKSLSKADQLQDIDMYWLMYKAGEIIIKGHVGDTELPLWNILWLIHEGETAASRSPSMRKGESYCHGAMQRDPTLYPDSEAEEVYHNWTFLNELYDQDTLPPGRSYFETDAREIIWAADYFGNQVKNYLTEDPNRTLNESIQLALLQYGSDSEAEKRYQQWHVQNEVFQSAS